MTEKEKCAQGLLYDANYDAELLAERLRAKELLYDYNRLRPSQQAERRALLERLLGKMGQQTVIEQPFFCDYGYNIEVGANFFANFNFVVLDEARISLPISTSWCWMRRKFASAIMFLSRLMSAFIRPDIRWTWRNVIRGWNMPVR